MSEASKSDDDHGAGDISSSDSEESLKPELSDCDETPGDNQTKPSNSAATKALSKKTDSSTGRKSGAKNFSRLEWKFLFKAFVTVSENSIEGAHQSSKTIWDQTANAFQHLTSRHLKKHPHHGQYFDEGGRNGEQLRQQFSNRLQPQLNKWFKVVKQLGEISGADRKQKYEKIAAKYNALPNIKKYGRLNLYDWELNIDIPKIAEEHPKWDSFLKGDIASGPAVAASASSKPIAKRPCGAKAAIAKKKIKSELKRKGVTTINIDSSDEDHGEDEVQILKVVKSAIHGTAKEFEQNRKAKAKDMKLQMRMTKLQFKMSTQTNATKMMEAWSTLDENAKHVFYDVIQKSMLDEDSELDDDDDDGDNKKKRPALPNPVSLSFDTADSPTVDAEKVEEAYPGIKKAAL